MQVMLHDEINKNTKDTDDTIASKYRIISTDALSIANQTNDDDVDVKEFTNSLYQQIFNFVSSYCISGKIKDVNTEKEIKAAFESVYPRSGVATFINITSTKLKMEQLMELAKIVLGIRLFNKNTGKGGYGIQNIDTETLDSLKSIVDDVDETIISIKTANQKRQKLIVKAILLKRKKEMITELERRKLSSLATDPDPIMDDDILDTNEDYEELLLLTSIEEKLLSFDSYNNEQIFVWINELAFHQQYLMFLHQLRTSFQHIYEKMMFISTEINQKYKDLNTLVGSKTVISKDVVYPKFLSLGNLWYECTEEALKFKYIKKSYDLLSTKYEKTIQNTLEITDDIYGYVKSHENSTTSRPNTSLLSDEAFYSRASESKMFYGENITACDEKARPVNYSDDVKRDSKQSSSDYDNFAENKIDTNNDIKQTSESKMNGSHDAKENYADKPYGDDCTLLHISNHPEFNQLIQKIPADPSLIDFQTQHNNNNSVVPKIEYNGCCPFTLTDKSGLMMIGDIQLGIVKYKERFYICENKIALKAFLKNPSYFIERVKKLILIQPEYLMLLNQSQDEQFYYTYMYLFPSPNNPQIYQEYIERVYTASRRKFKIKCDASTETPTHFIEHNIDPNYHWNEWDTRRQIIKIVNLTNCKTSSSQTTNTHFRRDNQTQVYLPKDNFSQTKRDKGTNPPIVTTYIAGLSGINKTTPKSNYVSRYIKPDNDEDETDSQEKSRQSSSRQQSESKSTTAIVRRNKKETDSEKRTGGRVVTLTLDL